MRAMVTRYHPPRAIVPLAHLTSGMEVTVPAPDGGSFPALLGRLDADLAAASLSLARRFAAGATLWCWSPQWPHHAQHVAVEFVHPVIVGKRALPAEAVDAADAVGALRALVSPGDVLLAIAAASEADVVSAMRRAPAWGIDTIWMGAGRRPEPGAANHVLWLEDDPGWAVYTGDAVWLYHVLWELTHVCFEHPGLLVEETRECEDEVCVTCSDEGRLAEVIDAVDPSVATVRTATGREQVDTTLVEPLGIGDLVVVHAGMAIERVGSGG